MVYGREAAEILSVFGNEAANVSVFDMCFSRCPFLARVRPRSG